MSQTKSANQSDMSSLFISIRNHDNLSFCHPHLIGTFSYVGLSLNSWSGFTAVPAPWQDKTNKCGTAPPYDCFNEVRPVTVLGSACNPGMHKALLDVSRCIVGYPWSPAQGILSLTCAWDPPDLKMREAAVHPNAEQWLRADQEWWEGLP